LLSVFGLPQLCAAVLEITNEYAKQKDCECQTDPNPRVFRWRHHRETKLARGCYVRPQICGVMMQGKTTVLDIKDNKRRQNKPV
jgi:hypothetical protein